LFCSTLPERQKHRRGHLKTDLLLNIFKDLYALQTLEWKLEAKKSLKNDRDESELLL